MRHTFRHLEAMRVRNSLGASLAILVIASACESAPPPPTSTRRDAGPRSDAFVDVCVRVASEPTVEVRPNDVVDVIVVVDNSRSMNEEAAQVREGINTFADTLAASGLDHHVVVISAVGTSGTGVCVPPPLGEGAPGCGDGESGRLRVIAEEVGSHDGPEVAVHTFSQYADFLRPGSLRAFLWITDDEATLDADVVRSSFEALVPDGFGPTVHHAIVGFFGEDGPSAWSDPSRGACSSLARVGGTYLRLAQCLTTGNLAAEGCYPGTVARVCESDWTETFARIASRTETVAIDEPISCTLRPPEAPDGRVLDFSRLEVIYRSGDEETVLRRSSTGRGCLDWHFDDDDHPTSIVLCDEACRRIHRDLEAELEVAVACFDDPD
jgi:hypothetical protein